MSDVHCKNCGYGGCLVSSRGYLCTKCGHANFTGPSYEGLKRRVAALEAELASAEQDAIRMLDVTADWASAFCAVRDRAVEKHHRATDLIDTLKQRIAKLEAENARLQKDSKRLDFMVAHGAMVLVIGDGFRTYQLDWCDGSGDEPEWRFTGEHGTWRDAIDEALEASDD